MNKLGVGIIGASPTNPGWAMVSHVPAINASADFTLAAVGTSRRETAEAAAASFGVPAFDNVAELINHPGVDIVVIAVKAPEHRALIIPALDAGEIVFSEWPLGANHAEAEELAAYAEGVGVRTVIGLQARYAPAVVKARGLIEEGFIGRVLASTLVTSGMVWGSVTDRSHA